MQTNGYSLPISVIIVEDHPSTLEGTQVLLERDHDIAVVGKTGSGAEALKLIGSLQPQVVVLDLLLPDMNGVLVARTIRRIYSEVAVLVLTGYDDYQSIQVLNEIGVQGYLLKTATGDEIIAAVRALAAGENIINGDPGYVQQMQQHSDLEKFHVSLRNGMVPCTMRELEVLRLVVAGWRNSEIGDTLGIKERTVEFHVRNIMAKMNIRTRGGVIRKAIQEGIITLEP